MNEIEERATRITEEVLGEFATSFLGYINDMTEHFCEEVAVRMATEQKAIDIDKAKEAFNKTCGWLAVYPWYNGVFEEFVKAMEE